jgi:hypothetical protein
VRNAHVEKRANKYVSDWLGKLARGYMGKLLSFSAPYTASAMIFRLGIWDSAGIGAICFLTYLAILNRVLLRRAAADLDKEDRTQHEKEMDHLGGYG